MFKKIQFYSVLTPLDKNHFSPTKTTAIATDDTKYYKPYQFKTN
jgi:hypothetical protein